MRRGNAILRSIAVAASIIALGGGALAADSLDNVGSLDFDGSGASAAEHASAHADLPSVAASVIAALVGGSNPSTTVSQRAAADDHANANASREHGNVNASKDDEDEDTDEDNDNDEDVDVDNEVSEGQHLGDTGTAGTKPGWGCGDKNHEHSGPPGRPGATPPPGCTNHDDD